MRDGNGNITVFDAPNALSTGPFGSSSINNNGAVTGPFEDGGQGGNIRGFVRDQNGNYTVFDVPNGISPKPAGINARGDVTGYFLDTSANGKPRAFVRDRNGNITVFYANASGTSSASINAGGAVTEPSRTLARATSNVALCAVHPDWAHNDFSTETLICRAENATASGERGQCKYAQQPGALMRRSSRLPRDR